MEDGQSNFAVKVVAGFVLKAGSLVQRPVHVCYCVFIS